MMFRTCRVATCLALAIVLAGCGGSKTGDGGGGESPTAPAPGGAPPPVPVPPPSSGMPHAYFNALAGRTETTAAYSLRDQAMLDTYARGTGGAGSIDVTYDFSGDPDPRKQDAAKVTIPRPAAWASRRASTPRAIRPRASST